jgi:hypothetical protein
MTGLFVAAADTSHSLQRHFSGALAVIVFAYIAWIANRREPLFGGFEFICGTFFAAFSDDQHPLVKLTCEKSRRSKAVKTRPVDGSVSTFNVWEFP